MTDFADRLERLRTDAGLSQRQLAAECGLHHHTIMRLERRQTQPNWKTLRKIAQRLGTTTRYLRGEDRLTW